MQVLFADSNHEVLHQTLMENGFTCDLFWDKPEEELKNILPQYDALVIRSKFILSAELLSKCNKLKCIGRVGAGMENIDLEFANKQNIICVNAPEGNRDAVGEHSAAMLLMLINHLKKADEEVRNNIWIRAENRGTEISGKTIGIIGFGNMGSSFAEKLQGFNCKILAYDKYDNSKIKLNKNVKESNLNEIFEQSDILSLHLPLTNETKYLINKNFINSFKKNIYIINTARGKCLKTDDLAEALKSGKVKGACLDVFENESDSFEKMNSADLPESIKFLLKSDKVILSPHIAGWTHESNFKMSKIIADKMTGVLKNFKN